MAAPTISSTSGPVFFFREFEEPYGFLSQWYASTFTAPTSPFAPKDAPHMAFLTMEQYMMYQKAIVFNDRDIADRIMLEPSPRKQKSLGRKVKGFDHKKWDKRKEQIVEEGNWWKMTQPKEGLMRKKLLKTGSRELVEVGVGLTMVVEAKYVQASPFDRIWGIGYDAANAEQNRGHWGENLLGKALMRVRDRLQAEEQISKDGMEGEEVKSA